MKKLLIFSLLLLALTVQGQTARTFKLDLTNDSHVVCFLPEKPSGRSSMR